MDSFEFDNVKAEKEDALWRYNMERKLMIGFRLIGFLLVLFLLLWLCFPTIVESADHFRLRFVSAFNKPLFTFIIVNIIILAVYALSNQKRTHKQSTRNNIYDEYVSSYRSIPAISAVVTANVSDFPVTEVSRVDKRIVLVENAVAASPVKQRAKIIDTITEKRVLREFRRSETAVSSREMVMSSIEPARKSMEEMSSEEFQLIIDSFIAERRKTLMQENIGHYSRRKESIVDHCIGRSVKVLLLLLSL
ncbi:hypothetical protein GOBAR_AA34396 [Gossypium barbadense]|uniref:DUF4408 domain-containing protein n=1 Tax=Gossypium barbadense TaxID=3634 RepID=A0A2P5W5F4_GOSBA|nr:hypothetical protein GOBAR_AA34396 [Gossypium barbadense]